MFSKRRSHNKPILIRAFCVNSLSFVNKFVATALHCVVLYVCNIRSNLKPLSAHFYHCFIILRKSNTHRIHIRYILPLCVIIPLSWTMPMMPFALYLFAKLQPALSFGVRQFVCLSASWISVRTLLHDIDIICS